MKKIEIERIDENRYGIHVIDTNSPNTVSYLVCTKYSISSDGYITLVGYDPVEFKKKIEFSEIVIKQ